MLTGSWADFLADAVYSYGFTALQKKLKALRKEGVKIHPPEKDVFKAFELCPFEKTKVVILGQDPYHSPDTANGLAFSVVAGKGHPPSLINIFKELHDDLGLEEPVSGDLSAWAKEGVLLLNTVLTVEEGKAGSHRAMGWEIFTDEVIRRLNKFPKPVVFMLWGNDAISKEVLITNPKHLVLKSTHPSPFSAAKPNAHAPTFLGSRPFSQANSHLAKFGTGLVDWSLNSDDN